MPIQEDSNEQIEREKRMAANMDGIYVNQRLIYVDADLFGPMPKRGSVHRYDGRRYTVVDAVEEDGVYTITLEANRA
jgi:hypothetical protein